MMTAQKTSNFYWACRNGDLDAVKKTLPNLKAPDLNRIELNGSTALHAASYYGHASIVGLLLRRGADATIRNKYGKTAKEEASTDETRALFETRMNMTEDDEDDDEQLPKSQFVELYINREHMDKSELATRILKARLGTYKAHQYTISASSNLEHLEQKYRQACKGDQHTLDIGNRLFSEYRRTGDFTCMLRFYTEETPFFTMIHGDETFLVEVYKHLIKYEECSYQGTTYRGLPLSSKDLEPYQWALAHPESLLEMRKLTSTSMSR